MDDLYINIVDYNPKRNRIILTVLNYMIADMNTNKMFQTTVKELFIRCRKLNISLVFFTQSYFLVPKDVTLNSTHYLIMKIRTKIELQNIAINHSADIDYKEVMNIYRECTYKPYSFLTIDTTLPADIPFRFRKNHIRFIIKMTLTDEINILADKIKANQAQYNLDREAAKISALSSGELEKNEYLTGEDLWYKPGVVEQNRFEYSPLGNVFNKKLEKDDKREEYTNEKQLQTIKNEHLKLVKRIKDDRPKLKSLRHQINKDDKATIIQAVKIRILLIFMNLGQLLIFRKDWKLVQ